MNYKDFFQCCNNNNNKNNTAQGETIMNNPEHQNDHWIEIVV